MLITKMFFYIIIIIIIYLINRQTISGAGVYNTEWAVVIASGYGPAEEIRTGIRRENISNAYKIKRDERARVVIPDNCKFVRGREQITNDVGTVCVEP